MLHLIVSSQGLYSFPAPLGSFESSFEVMGSVMAQPLTAMQPGNQCLPPAYAEFIGKYLMLLSGKPCPLDENSMSINCKPRPLSGPQFPHLNREGVALDEP